MNKSLVSTNTVNLPDKDYFTRAELLVSLRKQHPNYSSNDFSWVIFNLLKRELIFRIGFDSYTNKAFLSYRGGRKEPFTEEVRSTLLKNKNIGRVVVYNSSFFNEWLNELIAHGTLIVEVDRRNMGYAFEILKASFNRAVVLYNPSLQELSRYAKSQTIAITPLYTRSPMLLGNGKMCLEKLAVDVLTDRALRQFFSLDEASDMVSQMLNSYNFDKKALVRYASRRNVIQEIEKALLSLDDNKVKHSKG